MRAAPPNDRIEQVRSSPWFNVLRCGRYIAPLNVDAPANRAMRIYVGEPGFDFRVMYAFQTCGRWVYSVPSYVIDLQSGVCIRKEGTTPLGLTRPAACGRLAATVVDGVRRKTQLPYKMFIDYLGRLGVSVSRIPIVQKLSWTRISLANYCQERTGIFEADDSRSLMGERGGIMMGS